MKVIAKTKIACAGARPAAFHTVELLDDGSVRCGCANAVAQAEMFSGRLLLGASASIERGCAALAAVTLNASMLVESIVGAEGADMGQWKTPLDWYRLNPILLAALERAEAALHERTAVKKALIEAVEAVGYKRGMSKGDFRKTFKALWDVPVDSMDGLSVAAYSGDRWAVPYMPGWKEQIADKGLAVVDGKVVCGKTADSFFAIDPYPDSDEGYFVREFNLRGKKLVHVADQP